MLYQSRLNNYVDPAQMQGLLGLMQSNGQPQSQSQGYDFANDGMMPGKTMGAGLRNAFGNLLVAIRQSMNNMVEQAKADAATKGYGG